MRILYPIILVIVLVGCSTTEQKSQGDKLRDFNETLGDQKAQALNEAVDLFEEFLRLNFPNGKSFEDRTLTFLKELDTSCIKGSASAIDSSWLLETERNRKVYELFENSGLRREIWLYGYEECTPNNDLSELLDINIYYSFPDKYVPVTIESDSQLMKRAEHLSIMEGYEYESLLEVLKAKREIGKNSLYTNEYGDFIYGLIKHSEDSSYAKLFAGYQVENAVSPCVLVPSLIEFNGTKVDLSDPFIKRIIAIELFYPIILHDIKKINRKTTR